MTVDRAVNILYPRRFAWLTKPINLLKISISILTASFACGAFNLVGFIFYTSTIASENGSSTLRIPSCVLTSDVVLVQNVITILHRTATYALTLGANVVIVRKVFRSKRTLNKKSPNYVCYFTHLT